MAPDWERKLIGPGGGMEGAKVAFMDVSGSVLSSPMQLGPTSRMPSCRVRSASRSSSAAPSGPTSLNPAEITTREPMPLAPHSSTTLRTRSLGTTITARSTSPGTATTDG